MLKRKIGIEIEFLGPDRGEDSCADWYTEARNIKRTVLKNADVKLGNRYRGWELKSDCSVEDNHNYNRPGYEICTPPMKNSDDFKKLRGVLKTLRSMKCEVNDTCGLHVHVDTRGLSPYHIAAIVNRYNAFSEEIEEFFDESRIDNEFCHCTGDSVHTGMCALLAKTRKKFKELDLGEKYAKVNISAFYDHGTIEFRQHHGTLDASRVIAWAKFCENFVEQTVKDTKSFKPDVSWMTAIKNEHKRRAEMYPWRENWIAEIPRSFLVSEEKLFPAWTGSALKGLHGAARKNLQAT